MPEMAVAILANDDEQRAVLQMLVDGTGIARTTHSSGALPVAATDPSLRRIEDVKPEVLIIDIPAREPESALRAIELLHQEVPGTAIFAVGDLSQPHVIVSAMRSGAREFMPRPTTPNHVLEAFVRLASAQRKVRGSGVRGRVYTVVNAKGGSGATTVAVNTAVALHASHGGVALVDLAPLGHSALHLNVKPAFTVMDAVRNVHRLDSSLLETYMTRTPQGLRLLAGTSEPAPHEVAAAEFAKLFDMLVGHYQHVVVDASTRLDTAMRIVCDLSDMVLLVAHADVPSLWSAARVQQFLGESGTRERVRLVLNRFRKIPGFSEADAENVTGAKLLWKIPNHYPAVSASIDRGVPVSVQNHSEIARSFVGLAAALTESNQEPKPHGWSLFKGA